MGAWAENTFGNDTSCDWIVSFLSNPGLGAVTSAIEAVVGFDGYLDGRRADQCLAACEVIARLQGKWGVRNSFSEDLDTWVESNPTDVPNELKALADAAIERILGPDSELPQLWDGASRNDDWHNVIDDLRARVSG